MLIDRRRRWWPTVESWLVAAIPPATLGLATFAAFGYTAARMRSRLLGLAAALYLASLLPFVLSGESDGPIVGQAIVINLVIGTAHMLLVRPRFARALTRHDEISFQRERQALAAREMEANPAYREAILRRERREHARELIARDPQLATELCVGRPDLPRTFDDGGLVDVNHVPESVLATLPGFTVELAQQVVREREPRGGLLSVDDLVLFCGVPGDVMERCRDRLIVRLR